MQQANIDSVIYQSIHRHSVDAKRRVQIPAKWRSAADEGTQFALILWPHPGIPDACVLVLPPAAFSNLVQKITAMPFGDPRAEALRRILGEKSDRVPLDKAGRICLPDWMAKAADIGEEAILNGMLDRFQIWNPQRYDETRPKVQALAPDAFSMI
jgi:MraZ protein